MLQQEATSIDGIVNEPTINFVGKDGFWWWVGEVEDNEDPMELGRVKVRCLGYYTNIRGGTTADLKTDHLPWATVLQHTSQAGNDGQGESSGQLQPGAIVMGFFMDGENAQMPLVLGVMRLNKSSGSREKKEFAFTGEAMSSTSTGTINPASNKPGDPNSISVDNVRRPGVANNSVSTVAAAKTTQIGGKGSPSNIGTTPGVNGSGGNPTKPRQPSKPIPAGQGVGGPWKSVDYQLSYLLEDLADKSSLLVKDESGDFFNVITGKIVTAKELTAGIQNFLGAVFTQAISAMRGAASNLVEGLDTETLKEKANGVPYTIITEVQEAVTELLSSLCIVDNQLTQFIQDPLNAVTSQLDSFLQGAIDKATFVAQGVEDVIDRVFCNVQGVLDSLLSIIGRVTSALDSLEDAKEVMDAWQSGEQIFSNATDLFGQEKLSLSGLFSFFMNLFGGGNCERKPKGGEDDVGWFPLLGVTHCTPEEFADIDKFRGDSRGKCGDGQSGEGGSKSSGGGIYDSIFEEADPYLTTAKTWVNGAYELYIGTPGRQSTQQKRENGTTWTSVNINNTQHQEWMAKRSIKESNPDLTEEEIEAQAKDSVKNTTGKDSDTGNLQADHISYAGTLTQEVHGDDCKVIDLDLCRTVQGDIRLKCTGDMHLEVGGAFLMNAQGAPKQVDKKGKKVSDEVQKHTISFGSDVDWGFHGSKLEWNASEIKLAGQKVSITGKEWDNACKIQKNSAIEMALTADNSINMLTTHLFQQINEPKKDPLPEKSGITRVVRGSIETTMLDGGSSKDEIPRYSIDNKYGPCTLVFGEKGMNTTVEDEGAYKLDVKGGPMSMECKKNATIFADKDMTIECTETMKLIAKEIHLN